MPALSIASLSDFLESCSCSKDYLWIISSIIIEMILISRIAATLERLKIKITTQIAEICCECEGTDSEPEDEQEEVCSKEEYSESEDEEEEDCSDV